MRGLKWWDVLLPLLMAAFLIFIYPHTNWDHQLIAPYFDATQNAFFLKNEYFLSHVMHGKLRMVLQIIAATILILWACSWKFSRLVPHRRRLIWLFGGIVISTLTVAILKRFSIHACPWDLSRYGGYATELPLFGQLPEGEKPGRCFPGGHSSGGYALLVFYFGFLVTNTRWSIIGLFSALLVGTAMGWTQMMRGAHFLSHNLWTLWVVWVVLLVWYWVWPPVLQSRSAEKTTAATHFPLPTPATASANEASA